MILGDASGHGRAALARSALMRYTLRAYVEAGLEPRSALELAGQVLSDGTGEEFTTVAVAVYDTGTGTLTYALAGHPPPIVVGPTAHHPVTKSASPAVGWGMPTGRRQTTVSLPAGALVCLFSDGLTEARSRGRMLGREGLETRLRRLGPRASAGALVEGVRAGADGAPDDMAACIITPDPVRSASALRVEELELDGRQLDGGRAEEFLEACEVSRSERASLVAQARRVAAESGSPVLHVRAQPARGARHCHAKAALACGRRRDRAGCPAGPCPGLGRGQLERAVEAVDELGAVGAPHGKGLVKDGAVHLHDGKHQLHCSDGRGAALGGELLGARDDAGKRVLLVLGRVACAGPIRRGAGVRSLVDADRSQCGAGRAVEAERSKPALDLLLP